MSVQPVPTPADVAPKATHEGQPSATTNPEPAAAAPEVQPTDSPKPNVWDNPESAKAEIERLRRENGAARTNAKQQAADEARTALATEIGKALGLVKDEPADPTQLTEQLTASQADAKSAKVELAVFKAAAAAGGDPLALLDSASFLEKVRAIDPTDSGAVAAAITEAVTANPRLGAATPTDPTRVPAPNPAQGSSGSGAPAEQLSRADVERMYREGKHREIEQARKDGRLSNIQKK